MYQFDRKQRLRKRAQIDNLFRLGQCFMQYPLSIRYVIKDGSGFVGVVINSPKRYQKKAVCRNRIKRLIRENYRTNILPLKTKCLAENLDLYISLTYVSRKIIDFSQMKQVICQVIDRFLALKKDKDFKNGSV